MPTKHDLEQDQRIAANSEAIALLLDYIREIRDHFEPLSGLAEKVPEKWRKLVRLARVLATIGLVVPILANVAAWYFNKRQLHAMADQYAQVAGRIYYEENNAEVALPFLEKAISIDGECPDYLFTRAYMQGMAATRTLSNLKRPYTKTELDLAHRSYAEAVYLQGLDPKRPEPYVLQAQILTVLKEPRRARQAIEKAIELDPKNDFAYIRLAMIQLDCDKDVKGAEASLAKAMELNPKSKWAWLWKGIVDLEFKSDFAAARANCRKAIELDPKFDLAHYNLAWALASGKDKDYGLAREELKKALAVNPDYKEAFYAMGMFYGYEDNYTVANVWMDKAIELEARFLPAQKWKGIICGEMAHYEEAVKSFDAAIHLDPMNADLYVRRAKMYAAMNRKDEAKRDLNFALDLDAKGARTLLYLGNLEDDAEKAIAYYDRSIAFDANYDEAYAAKAKALMRQNKLQEALAAIEMAIRVCSYKPERFEKVKREIEEKASASRNRDVRTVDGTK